MKNRNTLLKTALVALASIGLVTADAMAQGPAPTTASGFRMYNSSTSNITLRADASAGVGTYLFPSLPTGTAQQIFTTNSTGLIQFSSFSDIAPLTFNAIWVGNSSNEPTELPAGVANQVLQINGSGAPVWTTINLLPSGSAPNTTLAWDGTSWVENTNLLANPTTGDVTINPSGGTTTVNSGTLVVPNISNTVGPLAATDEVLITDNAGNVTSTSPSNIVGAATLPLNNIYVGNASNNPAAYGPGTAGQVLQIVGLTPTWQSVNLLPTGSVENATLVWDNTNNVWEENTQVTMDETSGDITTTGDVTAVDATFTGTDINLTNTPTTSAPLTNETVLIVDPAGNVTETSPSNIVSAATLNQDAIWVGDATNSPTELASSGTAGDVLTVSGTGSPVWSTPTGTIAGKGKVTGTGTWTYTVTPGVDPSGATTVIMVTLTSTSSPGLQVTNLVTSITATTFDVEFPVNIGATETFHWTVIQ